MQKSRTPCADTNNNNKVNHNNKNNETCNASIFDAPCISLDLSVSSTTNNNINGSSQRCLPSTSVCSSSPAFLGKTSHYRRVERPTFQHFSEIASLPDEHPTSTTNYQERSPSTSPLDLRTWNSSPTRLAALSFSQYQQQPEQQRQRQYPPRVEPNKTEPRKQQQQHPISELLNRQHSAPSFESYSDDNEDDDIGDYDEGASPHNGLHDVNNIKNNGNKNDTNNDNVAFFRKRAKNKSLVLRSFSSDSTVTRPPVDDVDEGSSDVRAAPRRKKRRHRPKGVRIRWIADDPKVRASDEPSLDADDPAPSQSDADDPSQRRQRLGLPASVGAQNLTGKRHQCDKCEKTFASSSGYKKHNESKHMGIRYPCKLCSKEFIGPKEVEIHIDSVHYNKREYGCHLCEKRYNEEKVLRKHILWVHYKVRDYMCQECGKEFGQRVHLVRHYDSVHLGKVYSCHICLRQFTRDYRLKQHYVQDHRVTALQAKQYVLQHGQKATMESSDCNVITNNNNNNNSNENNDDDSNAIANNDDIVDCREKGKIDTNINKSVKNGSDDCVWGEDLSLKIAEENDVNEDVKSMVIDKNADDEKNGILTAPSSFAARDVNDRRALANYLLSKRVDGSHDYKNKVAHTNRHLPFSSPSFIPSSSAASLSSSSSALHPSLSTTVLPSTSGSSPTTSSSFLPTSNSLPILPAGDRFAMISPATPPSSLVISSFLPPPASSVAPSSHRSKPKFASSRTSFKSSRSPPATTDFSPRATKPKTATLAYPWPLLNSPASFYSTPTSFSRSTRLAPTSSTPLPYTPTSATASSTTPSPIVPLHSTSTHLPLSSTLFRFEPTSSPSIAPLRTTSSSLLPTSRPLPFTSTSSASSLTPAAPLNSHSMVLPGVPLRTSSSLPPNCRLVGGWAEVEAAEAILSLSRPRLDQALSK